jgi:hypothetical protein
MHSLSRLCTSIHPLRLLSAFIPCVHHVHLDPSIAPLYLLRYSTADPLNLLSTFRANPPIVHVGVGHYGQPTVTDWAESHCYWEDENWGAVVFSDESKFNLFGSDGRQWCWREPGQANNARYTKKLKHGGGNMMVWGCITRHGVGRLHCHSSYRKTLTHW